MNNICTEYCDLINKHFGNRIKSIIIYGSNIYNASASDLDVCIIVKDWSESLQTEIINKTLQFHKKFNLKIDEEIPHYNKLIFTEKEIIDTLENPPFYSGNEVVINDIVKTCEFLSSKEMKQRLLLNILTTDHLTVGEPTVEYEKKAFSIMVDVVVRYYNLKGDSASEILECFYKNRYTGAEGEMYLGYKQNYKQKEQYLLSKIKEYIGD